MITFVFWTLALQWNRALTQQNINIKDSVQNDVSKMTFHLLCVSGIWTSLALHLWYGFSLEQTRSNFRECPSHPNSFVHVKSGQKWLNWSPCYFYQDSVKTTLIHYRLFGVFRTLAFVNNIYLPHIDTKNPRRRIEAIHLLFILTNHFFSKNFAIWFLFDLK